MDAAIKHLTAKLNWAVGKTLNTGEIKKKKGGRKEEMESDRENKEREQQRGRETGGEEESTSERISFPRGKRGERGMLSGTSATSHTRSLKDALGQAEATGRTCVRSCTPVHLNKLPMPC